MGPTWAPDGPHEPCYQSSLFFRVASLALRQSHDNPRTTDMIMQDLRNITDSKTKFNFKTTAMSTRLQSMNCRHNSWCVFYVRNGYPVHLDQEFHEEFYSECIQYNILHTTFKKFDKCTSHGIKKNFTQWYFERFRECILHGNNATIHPTMATIAPNELFWIATVCTTAW